LNLEQQFKYQFNFKNGFFIILTIELILLGILYSYYTYFLNGMEEFRFEHSHYLWGLLLLPIILIIWTLRLNWKNKAILKYSSSKLLPYTHPIISNFRTILKFLLLNLGLLFFIIALANPQYGENKKIIERKVIDVMIALDISKSMLTEDILPEKSRLYIAKSYIKKLIDELKGNKIGIVLFAGDAISLQPLSINHELAIMSLDNVNTDLIPSYGTDLNKAIKICAQSFDLERDIKRSIILLSDGENHETSPIQLANMVNKKHAISINTVGIGTLKGGLIPIRKNNKIKSYKKDNEGRTITTKLEEQSLKEIAMSSKGSYTRADKRIINIDNILENLDDSKKRADELEIFTKYDDQFQGFLFIGILLFILHLIIPENRSRFADKLQLFKYE